ncbi:hypothetical protein SESBI_45879 [Sesbania bispinosa]|nr:hypothetical protein SESBI_45879 [Sesbania bispinosa]
MGNGNSSHTILSNNDATNSLKRDSYCCNNSLHSNSNRHRAEGSFEVSMGNWKENNGRTDVWGVEYKTGKPNRHCSFRLTANNIPTSTVDAIHFGVNDSADDNNKTDISLDITRAGRDGLRGGTISIETNSASPFTRRTRQQDFSVSTETSIVSYGGGSSFREGLFVVEKKRKVNSESAYMVTLAHYYVTKDVGLSIVVKISRKGNGFVVEVEGPVKHPSGDLRNVLVETCRNGIWSPAACSHCNKSGGGHTDNYESSLSNSTDNAHALSNFNGNSHARTSLGHHRFPSHFDPFSSFLILFHLFMEDHISHHFPLFLFRYFVHPANSSLDPYYLSLSTPPHSDLYTPVFCQTIIILSSPQIIIIKVQRCSPPNIPHRRPTKD